MTFHQMELFLSVCDHRSINRAAASSLVSQQGISKMIRELEQELGCTLLVRSKSGVTPTQQGAYFYQEARLILEKKQQLCANIGQVDAFSNTVLHLGMAFGMNSALPHTLIADFEAEHPHIHIDYSDHNDFYLETLLLKDEFDFCITTGVTNTDRLTATKLAEEPVFLCIPRTHPLAERTQVTMEDLKHDHFAMFSAQYHIRHHFLSACHRANFEPNILITSNDFNSLKEIAQYNNLLFVVPAHTLRTDDPWVRYLPFPDPYFRWEMFFAKKKNKTLTSSMESFYRYVQERAQLK